MFPFYAYFTAFGIPLLCWRFTGSGPLTTAALLAAIFFLYPVVDFVFTALSRGRPNTSVDAMKRALYRIPLYLTVPFQFAVTATAVIRGSENFGMAALCGILAGVSGGLLGVTAAHELIHRRKKWERNSGKALLFFAQYPHFQIEHFIHHAHVATLEDADTARRGESLYAFLFRSIVMGWIGCWEKESKRLTLRGKKVISVSNAMLMNTLLEILVLVAAGLAFNGNAVITLLFVGVTSIILLKLVNYVEHYGLLRKVIDGRLEPVGPHHSWDSQTPLTNLTLFNLGYHSEHHRHPQLGYEQLPEAMPTHTHPLPGGYFPMMLLATIPPLWHRTMEPRL